MLTFDHLSFTDGCGNRLTKFMEAQDKVEHDPEYRDVACGASHLQAQAHPVLLNFLSVM